MRLKPVETAITLGLIVCAIALWVVSDALFRAGALP